MGSGHDRKYQFLAQFLFPRMPLGLTTPYGYWQKIKMAVGTMKIEEQI